MTQPRRSSLPPRLVAFSLAAVCLGTLLPVPAFGAADLFQPNSTDGNPLFDKAKAAIVKVESGDEGLSLAGTGFFIDSQGTVLTSSTILGGNTTARVTVNGLQMDAKVLGNDPRSGLAMLRVTYPR